MYIYVITFKIENVLVFATQNTYIDVRFFIDLEMIEIKYEQIIFARKNTN